MIQGGRRAEGAPGKAGGSWGAARTPGTGATRHTRVPSPLIALSLRGWELSGGRRAPGGDGKGNEASWGVFPARETVLHPAQWVYEAGPGGD